MTLERIKKDDKMNSMGGQRNTLKRGDLKVDASVHDATLQRQSTVKRVERKSFASILHRSRKESMSPDSADIRDSLEGASLKSDKKKRSWINQTFFPNIPDHYYLAKKLYITKHNSTYGEVYMFLHNIISFLMCIAFIIDQYYSSLFVIKGVFISETILCFLVLLDTFLSCYISQMIYCYGYNFLLDILTLFPTFFLLIYVVIAKQKFDFYHNQIISILRLIRILRLFRQLDLLKNRFSRIIFKLILTIFSMIFISSGLIEFFENTLSQRHLDCQYINEETDWKPSCSDVYPASDMTYCDCGDNLCSALYDIVDEIGRPSLIRCIPSVPYYQAIFFILITVTGVGYESQATTTYSRALIVILVFTSLFTLPGQLTDLEHYVNSRSQFGGTYRPDVEDKHVIVCGHVNNKVKLVAFLKEFLHPDRFFSNSIQFHVVILHPSEPSAEVFQLITSFYFYNKVTYIRGSALVVKDLDRARADKAFGMFFLCDTEINEEMAILEDTSTVTRALSVSNYNPTLTCYAQVLQPSEREILKDSGTEVILCLDEFKTSLMAKNSICPGIATLVENLFHSFGGLTPELEANLSPWHQEYIHGINRELYYVILSPIFLKCIGYNFQAICDIFFHEYETIVIGLATEDQKKVIFNPLAQDMKEGFSSWKDFFLSYNVAVVLSENCLYVEKIANDLKEKEWCDRCLLNFASTVKSEEDKFDKERTYLAKKTKDIEDSTEKENNKRKMFVQSLTRGTQLLKNQSHLFRTSVRVLLPSSDEEDSKSGPTSPSAVLKEHSPVKRPSDKESDSSEEEDNNSNTSFQTEEEEEEEEESKEYVGFTQKVLDERKTIRISVAVVGARRTRLPTKIYIDTEKSMKRYQPTMISLGDKQNPFALLKLNEIKHPTQESPATVSVTSSPIQSAVLSFASRKSFHNKVSPLHVDTYETIKEEEDEGDDKDTTTRTQRIRSTSFIKDLRERARLSLFSKPTPEDIEGRSAGMNTGRDNELVASSLKETAHLFNTNDFEIKKNDNIENSITVSTIEYKCADEDEVDDDNNNNNYTIKSANSEVSFTSTATTPGIKKKTFFHEELALFRPRDKPFLDKESPLTLARLNKCVLTPINHNIVSLSVKVFTDNNNNSISNSAPLVLVDEELSYIRPVDEPFEVKEVMISNKKFESTVATSEKKSILGPPLVMLTTPSPKKTMRKIVSRPITSESLLQAAAGIGSPAKRDKSKTEDGTASSRSSMRRSFRKQGSDGGDRSSDRRRSSTRKSMRHSFHRQSSDSSDDRRSSVRRSMRLESGNSDALVVQDKSTHKVDNYDVVAEDMSPVVSSTRKSIRQSFHRQSSDSDGDRRSSVRRSMRLESGNSDALFVQDKSTHKVDNYDVVAVDTLVSTEKSSLSVRDSASSESVLTDNDFSSSLIARNRSRPRSYSYDDDRQHSATPNDKSARVFSVNNSISTIHEVVHGDDISNHTAIGSSIGQDSSLSVPKSVVGTKFIAGNIKPTRKLNFAAKDFDMISSPSSSHIDRGGEGYLEVSVGLIKSTVSSELQSKSSWRDIDIDIDEDDDLNDEDYFSGDELRAETKFASVIKYDSTKTSDDPMQGKSEGVEVMNPTPAQKKGPTFRHITEARKTLLENVKVVKLGYSDSDEESSSVFSSDEEYDMDNLMECGNPSREISDALLLSNHIVVFGYSPDNLLLFIAELRNPQIRGHFYHPIVIVDGAPPPRWQTIKETFNDVYFMPGDLTRSKFFNRINMEKAFACILMHNRQALSSLTIEGNVDLKTIISYLKIEHYVPSNVSFSVELISKENISVLNSTLMQRANNHDREQYLNNDMAFSDSEHHRAYNRRDIFASQNARIRAQLHQSETEDNNSAGLIFETSYYGKLMRGTSPIVPSISSTYNSNTSVPLKVDNFLTDENIKQEEDSGSDLILSPSKRPKNSSFATVARRTQLSPMKSPSLVMSTTTAQAPLTRMGSFTANMIPAKNRLSIAGAQDYKSISKKNLVKIDRRTISHKNKVVFYNELGVKEESYTPSAAYQFIYGEEEKEKAAINDDSMFVKSKDWWLWAKESASWTSWCTTVVNCTKLSRLSDYLKDDTNGAAEVSEGKDVVPSGVVQPRSNFILGVRSVDSFWDASGTHYILPVFASGRAYVPATFDSLLVQSFYGGLAPLICELIVCGQNNQIMMQIEMPKQFVNKQFSVLYRFFTSHRIICFGLYRHPRQSLGSLFPYLYLSPPSSAELYAEDKVFVFCSYSRLTTALDSLQ